MQKRFRVHWLLALLSLSEPAVETAEKAKDLHVLRSDSGVLCGSGVRGELRMSGWPAGGKCAFLLAGHRRRRSERGLARYYQRHGLSFFTTSEPQAVDAPFAIDTDTEALGRELTRAFPGVDFTNDAAVMANPVLWQQVLNATVNFMLRPMIDFARVQGMVGAAVTNLVVIPQIERPGGERLTPMGQEIAGMAVSPALLAVLPLTKRPKARSGRG